MKGDEKTKKETRQEQSIEPEEAPQPQIVSDNRVIGEREKLR